MDKPWRIVVHSTTSGRVAEIARRFGVEVIEVDVGEANVVTRMHELEKEGFFVPIGVEGYNGGTIFMGTEVRDGTLTALMSILALSEREVFQRLSERMGREKEYKQFLDKSYSLEDILGVLPHYNTVQGDLTSDAVVLSIEEVKYSIEHAFRNRIENTPEGIFTINGIRDMKFKKYEFRYYEETRVYVNKDDRRNKTGGFKIVLTDVHGREHFLWFRGSKTQPALFRIACDSSDSDFSQALSEFQKSLYIEAIKRPLLEAVNSAVLRPPMRFSKEEGKIELFSVNPNFYDGFYDILDSATIWWDRSIEAYAIFLKKEKIELENKIILFVGTETGEIPYEVAKEAKLVIVANPKFKTTSQDNIIVFGGPVQNLKPYLLKEHGINKVDIIFSSGLFYSDYRHRIQGLMSAGSVYDSLLISMRDIL
jgi:hypothetical protein